MKRQQRVLMIEDDESVSGMLKQRLESDGYQVFCAADEASAGASIASLDYEMVLLDLNLPSSDGVTLLKQIRARNQYLPVLVLTGRTDLADRVKALDLGADDYVAKPFEYGELVARIRALLRRASPDGLVSKYEDVEMNRMERTVTRAGRTIDLTGKEFALLEYLMLNAGQRLSRSTIMEHVWKLAFNPATNVVDVYINYLRNKVDRGFEHKLIRTVRGVGYQLGTEPVKGKQEIRN
ncbi:MAG: response regulator transcription factor [Acidobacteriota bacterium]|nr:response regulator transcription factor [Acidobacteriota bacterium]